MRGYSSKAAGDTQNDKVQLSSTVQRAISPHIHTHTHTHTHTQHNEVIFVKRHNANLYLTFSFKVLLSSEYVCLTACCICKCVSLYECDECVHFEVRHTHAQTHTQTHTHTHTHTQTHTHTH